MPINPYERDALMASIDEIMTAIDEHTLEGFTIVAFVKPNDVEMQEIDEATGHIPIPKGCEGVALKIVGAQSDSAKYSGLGAAMMTLRAGPEALLAGLETLKSMKGGGTFKNAPNKEQKQEANVVVADFIAKMTKPTKH